METVKEILKVKQVEIETDVMPIEYVTSSNELAKWLQSEIGNDSQESLVVLCLNTKNKLTHYSVVHRGTLDQSIATPKDIFQRAILSNASRIIIGHNHPSQILQPSKNDDDLTKRVVYNGKMLGIPVLDHIIVSEDSYYSYAEENKIKR